MNSAKQFEPGISQGETIDNQTIRDIFGCSDQGGMRRSHDTNTLVLVSDHVKSLYEDVWRGEVLHYTGMGLIGHQDINFSQNKTLNESNINGINMFLFEKFRTNEFVFQGRVILHEGAYKDRQFDKNGDLRDVWIFPIALSDSNITPVAFDAKLVHEKDERRIKKAQKLSVEQLLKRAQHQRGKSSPRTLVRTETQRNENVIVLARLLAGDNCQLCDKPAPFRDKRNKPFLEVHHVKWLARGGNDVIENAVALCPNCHRKMHIRPRKRNEKKLADKALNLAKAANARIE